MLFFAGSAMVMAQGSGDIGQRMAQNTQALRDYSWKMRTELKMGGESKVTSLFQIRFDMSGQMQKTLISAPPEPKKARGIKGKKIKQKQEEIKALVEALSMTALAYILPKPDQFQRFLQTANAWQGQGGTSGSTRLEGTGFAKPKDHVNLYVNSTTRDFQKMSATTDLEGNPVKIQADYRDMQNGPTYLAKMTLDYPEAGVQLIVENFDYMRQQ
jgi:hypothetical protein